MADELEALVLTSADSNDDDEDDNGNSVSRSFDFSDARNVDTILTFFKASLGCI